MFKKRISIIERNAIRYFKSAQDLFLPVEPIEGISGFVLRYPKRNYYFCGPETPFNDATSNRIVNSKFFANRLLEQAGIPVPKAYCLSKAEFKRERLTFVLNNLKFPMVIKPIGTTEGTGVLCNLQTQSDIENALVNHFQVYDEAIIEEFHNHLHSYRVLVFKQKIIGAVMRHPASVLGDGTHSIKELAEQDNIKRKKINPYLGPITLDQEVKIRLNELRITEDFIPRAGERIVLQYTSNATRGGSFGTCSLKICKENHQLMKKIAYVLAMDFIGIDIQCVDLSTPITSHKGVIIETNFTPSVRIHELPMWGPPQMVTRTIMRSFIYRHPLAYLHSLYFNKHTRLYVRSGLAALVFGLIYLLVKGII